MLRELGVNSAIYTVSNLLQKGAAFLLVPLYTMYLDPADYGILAIVTALQGFLGIAFTLGLTGSIVRFYFEYRDDPQTLAEFWSSILLFVILLSVVMSSLLLLVGEPLLRPFIGTVAFWPYIALGIGITLFQPVLQTFLSLLQARNQAWRYALFSLAHFGLTTLLTIAFVIFMRRGAAGALVATLIAMGVFFVLALWTVRADLRLCIRWRHLRDALTFGLPQIPHSLASQTTAMSDRLVLNAKLGTAVAGVYSIGAMVSLGIEVAAQSVSRAYVPLSMSALRSRDPHQLVQLRVVGALVVTGFCWLGAALGAFSHEVVWLLTTPQFAGAAAVIPLLAFAAVASAIYYLVVNVLFFERAAVKFLPVGTLTAATINVVLALTLVPRMGMQGAALATLTAQISATVLVAVIGRRFDPVKWDYGRYVLAFAVGLACSMYASTLAVDSVALTILLKLLLLAALAALLGIVFWGRPLVLGAVAVQMLKRRPAAALALLAMRTS